LRHRASEHCSWADLRPIITASLCVHNPSPTNRRLSESYARLPQVHYVCISTDQCKRESLPCLETIHHGIDLSKYRLQLKKESYLSFIGRIAPIKGTHLAIEIEKRAEIPLTIAGGVQPIFRDYFESMIKPQIDGKFMQYLGLAGLAAKNELLGNSLALLFPITWDELFGLVMIEAMPCGALVLALQAGSVPEIVKNGVSGYTPHNIDDLVRQTEVWDSHLLPFDLMSRKIPPKSEWPATTERAIHSNSERRRPRTLGSLT
jgi:glycosyltransferase involved in cell wall biosynthesis